MNRFFRWYQQHKRRQTLARVREHFAFFGLPLDGLSDGALETRVCDVGARLAKTGLSSQEFCAAFNRAFGRSQL